VAVFADIWPGIRDQRAGFVQILLDAKAHERQFSLVGRVRIRQRVDGKNFETQVFVVVQAVGKFTAGCAEQVGMGQVFERDVQTTDVFLQGGS